MKIKKLKTSQNKLQKICFTICAVVLLSTLFTLPAFAAGENLFEVADNIIRDVYKNIAGISTVLAGLMTAVAVVSIKFSSTQQKSDQAWDWLKRIWIAWAIINGIGAFLAYITPLFDGYATLPGGTGGTTGGTTNGGGGGTAAQVMFQIPFNLF